MIDSKNKKNSANLPLPIALIWVFNLVLKDLSCMRHTESLFSVGSHFVFKHQCQLSRSFNGGGYEL